MGIEKNDDYKQVWIKKKMKKLFFFIYFIKFILSRKLGGHEYPLAQSENKKKIK